MTIEIVTGDDLDIAVFIEKNDAPYPVDTGATVTGSLRDEDTLIGATVTFTSTDPGSVWGSGRLQWIMSSAQTSTLFSAPKGDNIHLEVQIIDSGKRTTALFPALIIKKGLLP